MEQLGFSTLVESFKSGKAPANLRGSIILLSQVCRAYLSTKDSGTRQIAQKMLYAATKNYFKKYEEEYHAYRTANEKKTLAQEKGTRGNNPKFQIQNSTRFRRRSDASARRKNPSHDNGRPRTGSLRNVSRPDETKS